MSVCESMWGIHCTDTSRSQSWQPFVSVLIFYLVWTGFFGSYTTVCNKLPRIHCIIHTLTNKNSGITKAQATCLAFILSLEFKIKFTMLLWLVLLHIEPSPQILSMGFTFPDISSYDLRSRLLSSFIPSFTSTRNYLFHRSLTSVSWQNQVNKLNFCTES